MRTLRILSIVALVSTMAFAAPTPPWSGTASVQIPVVMDIVPAVSIDLNGAQIKLLPSLTKDIWEGQANPQPIVHSNIPVKVSAALDVVNPNIQVDGTKWGIALQSSAAYTNGTVNPIVAPATFTGAVTPFWFLDVPYIGAGRAIPISVYVESPDLTVRPPELNSPVAIVTLTVQPS